MSGAPMTVAAADSGFFGWWNEGTRDAKRALIAAALGWMLDAFDVMLYALLLTSIIAVPSASPSMLQSPVSPYLPPALTSKSALPSLVMAFIG